MPGGSAVGSAARSADQGSAGPSAPGSAAEAADQFQERAWAGRCSRAGWAAWDAGAPIPAGCSGPSCPGRSDGTRCRTGRRTGCWAGPRAAGSAAGPAPPGARRCADDSGPGCRCCSPGAAPAGLRGGHRPQAAGRPAPGASAVAGGRREGAGRRVADDEPEGGRAEARRRPVPAVPRGRDDEHRTVHDRPPPARVARAWSPRGVEMDPDREERRRRADHEPEPRPRVVNHADAEGGGAREEDGGADPGAVDESGSEDDHAAVAVHAHETGSVPHEHDLGSGPVHVDVTRVVDVNGGRDLIDVGWPLVGHHERPLRGGGRVPDPLIARPVTARVEDHRIGRVDGVGEFRPLDPLELGRSVVGRLERLVSPHLGGLRDEGVCHRVRGLLRAGDERAHVADVGVGRDVAEGAGELIGRDVHPGSVEGRSPEPPPGGQHVGLARHHVDEHVALGVCDVEQVGLVAHRPVLRGALEHEELGGLGGNDDPGRRGGLEHGLLGRLLLRIPLQLDGRRGVPVEEGSNRR